MAIERAIYASLPLGIEKDSAGFQFFSYTDGFRHILESDSLGIIRGLAENGYTKHSGNEWLTDLPLDCDMSTVNENDFRVSIPESVGAANDAEIRAHRFNPYSFSYRPIEIDGTQMGVFSFGKLMGIDWSGARPGNIYLYTVVCDKEDIKSAPIMYHSSAAVCCDIPRSEFYPVSGNIARPDLLRYTESLGDEEDIAPVEYSAGFERISPDDIKRFIADDDNRKILCSMVYALMENKDGNVRRRIVIADEPENVMMWIAAISFIFPQENLYGLSFSTYTHAPADFDINGVFVPAKNGCFPSSRSGYDFNSARGAYAVYDFGEGEYASEVNPRECLFTDALKSRSAAPLMEAYKTFITRHSDYRGLDSYYAKGYSFYAFMTGKMKYSLEDAVDFAEKYALDGDKKELLLKILNDFESISESPENLHTAHGYMKFCCDNKISTREKINEFFVEKYNEIFRSDSPDDILQAAENKCMKMCGISDEELEILFVKVNGTAELARFAASTKSVRRLMYINNAVLLNAAKGNANTAIGCETNEGKIITITIARMINDDSEKSVKQMEDYIHQCWDYIKDCESQIGVCDSVMAAVVQKGLERCEHLVRGIAADMYKSGDGDIRRAFFSAKSPFLEDYIAEIISRISLEKDVRSRISRADDFCYYAGETAVKYCDSIKNVVKDSVTNLPRLSGDLKPQTIYSAFKVLKTLYEHCPGQHPGSGQIVAADFEFIYTEYICAVQENAPDYIIGKAHMTALSEIREMVAKTDGDTYDGVFGLFESLARLSDELDAPMESTCFWSAENLTFTPINVSQIEDDALREIYISSVGKLCGLFWARNDTFPTFWTPVEYDSADADNIHRIIFTAMYKTALKEMKHNSDAAAFVIKFALARKYTEVISTMNEWLDECNVKRNVVDILARDCKAKSEPKKDSEDGIL